MNISVAGLTFLFVFPFLLGALPLPEVKAAPLPVGHSGYNQPPKEILDVMHAAPLPSPLVSPTHDKILLVAMEDYPSIERVATPFLRLAGVRVEPGNHSKHDTPGGYGIPACARSFTLVKVEDGAQKEISTAKLKCADQPQWSSDGNISSLKIAQRPRWIYGSVTQKRVL